ncbi:MAG: hypothetical protein RRZ24_06885 [Clostridia bacterium]
MFRVWLEKIVRNLSLNRCAYNHAAKRYAGAEALLDELSDCISDSNTTEAVIEAQELSIHISDFLDALSETDRAIFVRRYWSGEDVSATLYPGGCSGRFTGVCGVDDPDGSANILQLNFWGDYKTLLESGSYMADAFSKYPTCSQQVTVYEFADFEAPPTEYDAATQAISFTIDPEKTQILLYGFNGGQYGEGGERRFSYSVPNETRRESDEKYLIVIGEDFGEYTLQDYQNGACEKGNELDGVSVNVTRKQCLLSDVLRNTIDNFISVYGDTIRRQSENYHFKREPCKHATH